MSLVEKALEKLRTGASTERSVAAERRVPAERAGAGAAPAAPSVSTAVPPLALPRTPNPPPAALLADVPPLDIDLAALVADRVLPADAEAHRASGDYRAIKRVLLESAFHGTGAGAADPRLVAISSALAGDGKTHTAINLALSFARERDHAVVLVDADLPKAHLTEVLGLRSRAGLTELLSRESEVDVRDVLHRTSIGGLWVVGAGRVNPDSSELLGSQRMAAACRQLFQLLPNAVVLLDSPPLLLTTEAQVIAGLAGQIVLVVRAGVTPRPAVADAVAKIPERSRIRVVLNGVDQGGLADYYYHYGQYGTEKR